MDLAIAVFVVAVLFWFTVELAAVAGLFGALSGERIERCAQCRRFGLTEHGAMHPNGCPEHLGARARHLAATRPHLHFHRLHSPHTPH